jgi:hypothetical protein
MGPIDCPEKAVSKYQHEMNENTEERSPELSASARRPSSMELFVASDHV